MVIGDVRADVVIDSQNNFIIGGIIHIQFIQKLFDTLVDCLLLGESRVIGHNERNIPVDGSILCIESLRFITPAAVLPSDVVAFHRYAGMGHGNGDGFVHECGQGFLAGIRNVDMEHNGLLSLFHIFPDSQRDRLDGVRVVVLFGGTAVTEGNKVGLEEGIPIKWVDICPFGLKGCLMGVGEDGSGKGSEDKHQGKRQSKYSAYHERYLLGF